MIMIIIITIYIILNTGNIYHFVRLKIIDVFLFTSPQSKLFNGSDFKNVGLIHFINLYSTQVTCKLRRRIKESDIKFGITFLAVRKFYMQFIN